MDILKTILIDNGSQILMFILTAIATWIGTTYKKYIDTKQKREIIEATVKYIEQTGKNLSSTEKFLKAKEKALLWLKEKGLKISDTELEILIESVVHSFNKEIDVLK